MRVEPYGIGSVVHVVKRGARGMPITQDESDRWRFVRTLYVLNDTYQDPMRSRGWGDELFARPEHWPERDPLCAVLAWTLMPNHFHLLLIEIREGGIAKFMQRLGGSMSTAFNEKYGEKGSLFQGSYRSCTVDSDQYLQYLLAYVLVKNVFELYPNGLTRALNDFDTAWEWAKTYPFSSFRSMCEGRQSPIIDVGQLTALGLPAKDFKQHAHDALVTHLQSRDDLTAHLHLEDW